jgi:hypothetical protein
VSLQSQVAINNDGKAPDASAILDASSSPKGLLLPGLTNVERDAIDSPAAGLFILILMSRHCNFMMVPHGNILYRHLVSLVFK